MNQHKHFADVETPVPGPAWVGLEGAKRLDLVVGRLAASPAQFLSAVDVIAAKADGQVILHLKLAQSAGQRGPFLLDLEGYLKSTIDDAITVWLEPLGDRNSLRNLRGIEVKA